MLAIVADDKPINDLKSLLGTGNPNSPTGNWKIWMTEFNAYQPTGMKDAHNQDIAAILQDMGHALVIADWTGKMLEQNIERMFMHSLDNTSEFALVQYDNGTDIEHPRVTVPGHAFSIYAQEFGKTMLRNTIDGNVVLTAPSGKTYPQLAVYSSVSADNMSLRVIVINRHMTDSAKVNIDTQNATWRRKLANGQYGFRQLYANNITDSNQVVKDFVKWSDVQYFNQAETGIENVSLAPASASLFIIPLQP
jgi:alpha-L-arabinofuranosidase